MFNTHTVNTLNGKVCGVDIAITITASAPQTCATAMVGGMHVPQNHEVLNVATFLLSACNGVLKSLEQDDAGITAVMNEAQLRQAAQVQQTPQGKVVSNEEFEKMRQRKKLTGDDDNGAA